MRAILIATGINSSLGLLDERLVSPMLPILDRPTLQHVIESLTTRGFKEFDLVVCHLAHQIEDSLGDGGRWGITIRYHLVRDGNRPYRVLRTMSPPFGDSFAMLGNADRFPGMESLDPPTSGHGPALFCEAGEADGRATLDWTGWAWIDKNVIAAMMDELEGENLSVRLFTLAVDRGSIIRATRGLVARDFTSLLESNQDAILGRGPVLMFEGREVEQGIWLSRNVQLHPTAVLTAPVYIGEDCQIGEGVKLGPGTIVGAGCVIDSRASLVRSVVYRGSYIGRGIDLHDAVVVHNHLIDVRDGTQLCFEDGLLLSSVACRSFGELVMAYIDRLIALVLLMFTWPLLIVTALALRITGGRRVFDSAEVVRLPAPSNPTGWKKYRLWRFRPHSTVSSIPVRGSGLGDFLLRFLPGLINVTRGEIRIVGNPPRTAEEIMSLPDDWRVMYLQAKAGLINETSLVCPESLHMEDLHISEAYYSVASGFRLDFLLLVGYLRRLLSPPGTLAQTSFPAAPNRRGRGMSRFRRREIGNARGRDIGGTHRLGATLQLLVRGE